MAKNRPLLSVVIPCYNVEQYLQECVDSVRFCTYKNLEIILVNDGSTDFTGELCNQIEANDTRIKVIHQSNAGLGAARNVGVRAAQGQYLAFVDSDDLVCEKAYDLMISSLEKSGSGVCVGAVERFNSKGRWLPWFVEEVHSKNLIGTNGKEFPPLLWNVFAWSKVFRRQTFLDNVGEFPENILYEDQEMSAKLYLGNVKVDVLEELVYFWRARDDSSSITQNKTDIRDLEDRLTVARRTLKIVQEYGDDAVLEYWFRKFLGEDLWWYFRAVPRVSAQYWATLSEAVREFIEAAPASVVMNVAPKRRDLLTCAWYGDRMSFEKRLRRS